ncbi:zinc-binding dehydrogenase [Pasteurellaceae bacterium HPA106]|uniref:alcohol dehydrogenase catalytic domain-containing protein n=1 Tax=Spirabiliibacterium pneumoniae TaxID=221400 RepID=UPI001AAC6602|nr:zinc-binding dehydrogenase [Spirabiliibacterium pneumoniae]MBE2896514.1 zinc-binding dehydrogenase [Spirabiliibacterium pneumoniae]
MKAIVVRNPCGANALQVEEVALPLVRKGWVRVKIRAFGINRAEIYTRNGLSPEVKFPRIIGIECVGEIDDPSDSDFTKGQKVVSLMKGMGRNFDGSYAEYVLIPSDQVYPIRSNIPWNILASIPIGYGTAFGSLFEVLHLKHNEHLLIRGATSSVGLAAVKFAKALDCFVYATTRNLSHKNKLIALGVDQVIFDDGNLAKKGLKVDKTLELVGAKTVKDSLKCTRCGGIVCFTGILSGWIVHDFYPIDDIPTGVYLSSFHSDNLNKESIINLFDFIDRHAIKLENPISFPLSEISQAHKLMESNQSINKIVIVNFEE